MQHVVATPPERGERVESMPDERDRTPNGNAASIDFDLLDRIGDRFASDGRFEDVTLRPGYAPDSVILEYAVGYFPVAVEQAYLRVRWYENDDFNVHYSEQYADGEHWECRWDRHPNSHNARDHFHPPPDAQTPGRDERYPTDWRNVLANVLTELDARIQAFWEQ